MILLAIGVVAYGIDLPSGGDWLTLAWVTVLGSAACTLLGIAISSLAKNGRSASATVTPFALLLQFISGVFFQFSQIPELDADGRRVLPAQVDGPGAAVGVPARLHGGGRAGRQLGAGDGSRWSCSPGASVGLVLCVLTFRWQDKVAR